MNLVSVIVPIYNETDHLIACVDSLLAQRYSDIEIVLVDDGSDADSLSISRKYADAHTNIRLIEIANSGVSHARNVGIDAATGTYLTFVDSDDIVSPEYVGHLVQAIQNPEVDLVAGLFTFSHLDQSTTCGLGDIRTIKRDEAALQFADSYGWYCWGKIYRRSLISDHSIRFNESVAVCEDLLFNIEVLRRCRLIALLDTVDYLYRQSKSSTTNDLDNIRWFDALDAHESALSMGTKDRYLAQALSFNCEFMLCEARYRLRSVPLNEREALRRKIDEVARLLPQDRRYSLKQSIKLASFKLFPGAVMKFRRRRVA